MSVDQRVVCVLDEGAGLGVLTREMIERISREGALVVRTIEAPPTAIPLPVLKAEGVRVMNRAARRRLARGRR